MSVPMRSAGSKVGGETGCGENPGVDSLGQRGDGPGFLASPGTPSRRMCPLESRPISSVSTRWLWPTMTLPISVRSVSTKTDSRSIRSLSSLMFDDFAHLSMLSLFRIICSIPAVKPSLHFGVRNVRALSDGFPGGGTRSTDTKPRADRGAGGFDRDGGCLSLHF